MLRLFAIFSDVGIQMPNWYWEKSKNYKGSNDSKDQTKETNIVEQLADSSYRLALQMRMKHVKNSWTYLSKFAQV